MIVPNDREGAHGREIARGLAAAVHAAVESARAVDGHKHTLAWGAAAGVAELLDLAGLASLLAACKAHADAPPPAVAHVLDRLARLAAETEDAGAIAPFVAADRELEALAGVLGAQDWATESEQAPTRVPVQSLSELLTDFELDDPAAVANAQLTLPVAAGLRAALDWLGADAGGRLRVNVMDAVLTLAVRATHEPGLAPAGAVLALMSGALLSEPDGRWLVRVPLFAQRPAFLLARQGELALALPWHVVARLRITDDAARTALTEPSLAPWSPLTRTRGERPTALIAHGLSRAWLHLDHIVWRVFASPEPGLAPAAVPGGRQRVITEEGADFWVVDAGDALRGVPPLDTPAPRPRPRVAAAEPASAERALPQVAPSGKVWARDEAAAPAVFVLTPDHVRPLAGPHAVGSRPALEPTPAAFEQDPREALRSGPASLDASAVTPIAAPALESRMRRALVADDSLVTRMALSRVLEREGWVVEGVERCEQLWAAVREHAWSVVFVDVHLPDAPGSTHLHALVEHERAGPQHFEIVALTRDGTEQRVAREAGIRHTLAKPYAAGVIVGLVRQLPAARAGA